ncbi:SDR family oxidoreductase [Haliea sp. E1-2-M8]|uniref:SDR family oxidoreductase n=1 Tax=Haliea sp. E1-2-M8 TaxID=3064706 RepID=UPI0027172169|nr:SDR family oxidoreductase [Haliea sp. E1-2-M8]MDO8860832.1 SDR family oxidoreductase [Haliea sp. E1-2-M8]
MQLAGKRFVLTGAAGGIGQAFAAALAGAGAQLLLVSRSEDALEALCGRLPGSGHQLVAADLATAGGRAALVTAAGVEVDGLINNAGVSFFGLLGEQGEAELRQTLELNLLLPMLLVRDLLPALQARGGTIVNVGSAFGSIGFAGNVAYSGSKFGLRGFTEALRRELADSGVNVQYLAPRATATSMNSAAVQAMNSELGTAMDPPERVADELMALLARGNGVRFIGWPERFFIKLNSVLPGLVDKALLRQLPVVRRHALAAATARE